MISDLHCNFDGVFGLHTFFHDTTRISLFYLKFHKLWCLVHVASNIIVAGNIFICDQHSNAYNKWLKNAYQSENQQRNPSTSKLVETKYWNKTEQSDEQKKNSNHPKSNMLKRAARLLAFVPRRSQTIVNTFYDFKILCTSIDASERHRDLFGGKKFKFGIYLSWHA